MTTTPADPVEEVRTEIAQLRDLFHRRLLNDRAKAQAIDQLSEQIEYLRSGFTQRALVPLVADLLVLHDRVATVVDDAVAASVVAEIEGIFARYGVRQVGAGNPGELPTFDPAVHRCVRTEPTGEATANTVLAVVRQGYEVSGVLIRPADVIVAFHPASVQEATPGDPLDDTAVGGTAEEASVDSLSADVTEP